MSLNWDITRVDEKVAYQTDENGDKIFGPYTNTIISMTFILDMGEITEKNLDEWYFRLELFQDMSGPLLQGPKGNKRLTIDVVKDFVGLSTNVRTTTKTQFKNKCFRIWEQDFNRKKEKAKKAA